MIYDLLGIKISLLKIQAIGVPTINYLHAPAVNIPILFKGEDDFKNIIIGLIQDVEYRYNREGDYDLIIEKENIKKKGWPESVEEIIAGERIIPVYQDLLKKWEEVTHQLYTNPRIII